MCKHYTMVSRITKKSLQLSKGVKIYKFVPVSNNSFIASRIYGLKIN